MKDQLEDNFSMSFAFGVSALSWRSVTRTSCKKHREWHRHRIRKGRSSAAAIFVQILQWLLPRY